MYGGRDNHSNGPTVRVNVAPRVRVVQTRAEALQKDNRDSGDHRAVIS